MSGTSPDSVQRRYVGHFCASGTFNADLCAFDHKCHELCVEVRHVWVALCHDVMSLALRTAAFHNTLVAAFVVLAGVIESKYLVTRAVENWVSSHHFQLDLTRKYFRDIDGVEDTQDRCTLACAEEAHHIAIAKLAAFPCEDWLRFALPRVLAPPMQQANFPLYGVARRNLQAHFWPRKVSLEGTS